MQGWASLWDSFGMPPGNGPFTFCWDHSYSGLCSPAPTHPPPINAFCIAAGWVMLMAFLTWGLVGPEPLGGSKPKKQDAPASSLAGLRLPPYEKPWVPLLLLPPLPPSVTWFGV